MVGRSRVCATPHRAERGRRRAAGAERRRQAGGCAAAQPGKGAARRRRRCPATRRSGPHPVAARARGRGAVGQLRPGPSPLAPRLELLLADSLHGQTRGAIGQRLGQWLDGHSVELTMPLRRLQVAELEAPGRGLASCWSRAWATCAPRRRSRCSRTEPADCASHEARRAIRGQARLSGLDAAGARGRPARQAVGDSAPDRDREPAGVRDVPHLCRHSKQAAEAAGYEVLADVCVRIDVVERLAARLRAGARRRLIWTWSCCA